MQYFGSESKQVKVDKKGNSEEISCFIELFGRLKASPRYGTY
jgi:hypothetical protein